MDSCLVKDPSKRPTAEELLQTPFFRAAKKKSYLVSAILKDLPPLTQRQERRVLSRIASVNSVESWDFTTTIHSPTASIYKRRFPEDPFTGDDKKSLNSSATNSRSVLNSITTPSGSSSVLHTRSSYGESTDSPYGIQEKLSAEFGPGSESVISIAEKPNQNGLVLLEPSLPGPSPRTPGGGQFIPPSTTTPIASTSQQGLWRKLTNNVRSSSRSDDEGLDSSPRKKKGKIGGIFASASKGLLSSRSLANVVREGR